MPTKVRWLPTALSAGALGLFLVTPDINGPLLVLGWLGVLTVYRYIAAIAPTRGAKAVVDCAFLVLSAVAVFSGGWLFIPAGIAFLLVDLRGPGATDGDGRVPGLESVAGVVGAIVGWIALALVTADRLAATSRVTIVHGPDGDTVESGTLAELAAAGMPTDRPTIVIAASGLLLGLMLISAIAHDRTGKHWTHGLLGATVVGVGAIAVVGSMTIGMYLLPAVACGILAWLIGWRRDDRDVTQHLRSRSS